MLSHYTGQPRPPAKRSREFKPSDSRISQQNSVPRFFRTPSETKPQPPLVLPPIQKPADIPQSTSIPSSSPSTKQVVNLFTYQYPQPEMIDIYDENQDWVRYTPEMYNLKFGTVLTHGIVTLNGEKKSELIQKTQAQSQKFVSAQLDEKAFHQFITNPINYFSISYINATCGYGLVANQDIPAHTIIGTYSAELLFTKDKASKRGAPEDRAYDMGIRLTNNADDLSIKLEGETYSHRYAYNFRALVYSDLTRFALHAPDSNRINYLIQNDLLDWKYRTNILRTNTNYHQIVYQNTPMRYYKTITPIKKYELIRIDYGVSYWSTTFAKNQQATIVERNNQGYTAIKKEGMPCLFVNDPLRPQQLSVLNFDEKINAYALSKEVIHLPKRGIIFFSPNEAKEAAQNKLQKETSLPRKEFR